MVKDVTSEYPQSIKAEQLGGKILVVRKLLRWYEVEYIWVNPKNNYKLGSTCSYYKMSELDINKNLFEQIK